MQVNTFGLAIDSESNLTYIFQRIDKADKNHGSNNTTIANQGRNYQPQVLKHHLNYAIFHNILT